VCTYRHSDAQVSMRSEWGVKRERERADSNLRDFRESPLYRGGCLQSRCKAHVRLGGYKFVGNVTTEERFTKA